MDEYFIGIMALGIAAGVLLFLVKLLDRIRYSDRRPQDDELVPHKRELFGGP